MFSGIMEKNRGQEIGYKVSVPNQLKVNNKAATGKWRRNGIVIVNFQLLLLRQFMCIYADCTNLCLYGYPVVFTKIFHNNKKKNNAILRIKQGGQDDQCNWHNNK